MSLKTLLDRIEPYASGWDRSTGLSNLTQLIQQGLDELYDCDGPGRVFYSNDNEGFPPYLITQSNVYEYEIKADNLSVDALTKTIDGVSYPVTAERVIRVFVDVSKYNYDYSTRYLGKPYVYYGINPYSRTNNRLWVADIRLENDPAYESTPARVRFLEDPGAHTEKYIVEFTWRAPRLTSESIKLPIPPRFEMALQDFALGQVEQLSNGKENARLARFYTGTNSFPVSWKDQFRATMRKGARAKPLQTEIRYV